MKPYQLSDEEDPELLAGGLTPGTSQQAAPSLTPPTQNIQDGNTNYNFTPGPNGSLVNTQKKPAVPLYSPPTSQAKTILPGMPAGMTPDQLQPYLARQKGQLNQYGPDQRMALQKSLNDRQNSLGYKITDAGKGFADALMMGVARAGNPNWQGEFHQQEQQNALNQTSALKEAGEMNQQQVQSNMAVDKMDPQSALSKSAQQNYAPLFAKLGYPPGKLNGMSAANIDSALQLMTAYGGKEMEAKIKEYELEIERARLGQTTAKIASDEKMAKQGQKIQAAKELAGLTDNARFAGVAIPFTKGPTKESAAGSKYLEEQLSDGETQEFKTEDEAAAANLPDGTPVVIGGVSGKWRHQ